MWLMLSLIADTHQLKLALSELLRNSEVEYANTSGKLSSAETMMKPGVNDTPQTENALSANISFKSALVFNCLRLALLLKQPAAICLICSVVLRLALNTNGQARRRFITQSRTSLLSYLIFLFFISQKTLNEDSPTCGSSFCSQYEILFQNHFLPANYINALTQSLQAGAILSHQPTG